MEMFILLFFSAFVGMSAKHVKDQNNQINHPRPIVEKCRSTSGKQGQRVKTCTLHYQELGGTSQKVR